MSDARLIVWDADTGRSVTEIDLYARPVVGDAVDRVVIGLETPHLGSVTILPEWAGMEMSIEVSPSAVTTERIMQDIAAVATLMKVPVG